MIFGSGIGDIEFEFPAGVGIKIPAGHQLVLNLHLFNYGEEALSGTSGTLAQIVSASEIENEAESVLMGKVPTLQVPPGPSTQVGECVMEQDVTLLTIGPHMHELGSHMKVEAVRGEEVTTLLDETYDFFDQKLYELDEPLQLNRDDRIRVHCSYNNTTGQTVGFGDSSTEEMCFAGMYRYPKRSNTPFGFACFVN